jgi:hypothetical protein
MGREDARAVADRRMTEHAPRQDAAADLGVLAQRPILQERSRSQFGGARPGEAFARDFRAGGFDRRFGWSPDGFRGSFQLSPPGCGLR